MERRLGPFLLVEQLGRGGFAPVWLAREVYGATALRTAAVKLFALQRSHRKSGPSDAASRARDHIIREARALCQVEHPNVVRFYSLPIDEGSGVMGLAMEHVAGRPLDQRLKAEGRLSLAETLAMGIAIASALSAVHRAGLVHRDVKPSNVIEAAGVYKLIDFGIAAAEALLSSEASPSSPSAGLASDLPPEAPAPRARAAEGGATVSLARRSGTVGYIDPACVANGAPAAPASDLYSLGAMLFECLAGKVPAAAAAPMGAELDVDVLEGYAKAPSVAAFAPEVSPSLARVIDALLEPDRGERPPSAEWVAIRLEQVDREITGLSRALPPEEVGPFRGLGRFEERDRDVYFGRASEAAAAFEVLRSRGLAALSGSSGSGKSSLARAGVLPAVAEGALGGWPRQWDTAVTEPGQDPRAAVTVALSRFVPDAGDKTPEALAVALADRAQKAGRGVILLVDQLEELATLASGESQAWTATFLVRLGQQTLPGVRAVVAARRDLLDPLFAMGELGKTLVRGLILIEPITYLVWGDVLDQALAAYGYTFEDDALRRDLLAELDATAGAMPLVQFALTELWQKRDPVAKKVTRAGFVAIGGVAGALGRHADETLSAIARARPGAEEAAPRALLALTTPQGTRATRSLADLQRAAGPAGKEVIDALERARLIVPGAHGVTLAHEALLTQWGKLRQWVAEARQDRLLAEELERDAALWGADPEAVPLWQRRRLAFGEDLRKRGAFAISANAVAFLAASRWAERRLRLLFAGSALTVGLSLLWVGYAYVRTIQDKQLSDQRALSQVEAALRKEKTSRELAEQQTDALKAKEAEVADLVNRLKAARDKETQRELEAQLKETLQISRPPPILVSAQGSAERAPPPTVSAEAPVLSPPKAAGSPLPTASVFR
jgi:serine/threonine protein kinase